ncbi:hypothetical protein AVEN_265708-1 [Araneus ventricosus]|uniref:HAT C-terminal dimerisation domain-containing protein n=1 Tax=Araneus ventricosus TaxID=182803 RepID=A0A4Y2PWV0_ARAVE|nr:hypothetical protein AVEN_265708-1 [Araneus ventricosus]
MILILSHGQASIERGFSINKHIEVENLKEMSYTVKRLVYDNIQSYTHVHEVPITEDLWKSVASSRTKDEEYLEENRKQQMAISSQMKRKHFCDELEVLKRGEKMFRRIKISRNFCR